MPWAGAWGERKALSTPGNQEDVRRPFSCLLPYSRPGSWNRGMEQTAQRPAPSSEGHPWGSSLGGVSLGDGLISKLHEQADSCGCCVELGHLVLVHDAPQAAHIRVCGDPLKLTP